MRAAPLAAAAVAAVLAACAAPPRTDPGPPPGPSAAREPLQRSPDRPIAFASTLVCGDRIATIGVRGNRPVLVADGRESAVRRVASATGARYEAVDDPSTWVWSRGATALVSVAGRPWPECEVAASAAGTGPTAPPFVARGNEPAWRLELGERRLRFVPGLDGAPVEADTPVAQPAGAGRRWSADARGRALTVTALDRVCVDTMSGMPYPLAVTVDWAQRRWTGCGGDPASLLRGVAWVVEDVDRLGVVDRSLATVVFLPGGRVAGRGSCNDYAGRWTLDGESLRITGLAPGDRRCAPALMEQEQRLLARLAAVRRFELAPDGALRLRDDRDGEVTARR